MIYIKKFVKSVSIIRYIYLINSCIAHQIFLLRSLKYMQRTKNQLKFSKDLFNHALKTPLSFSYLLVNCPINHPILWSSTRSNPKEYPREKGEKNNTITYTV